jgi:endo-1,4-beta-mannosidase
MPSWAATLYEQWAYFDGDQAARELAAAARYGANAIRIWWDWHAWRMHRRKAMAAFEESVEIIGDLGMKVMPTLFNLWHDGLYPAGGTHLEFLYNCPREIFREYVGEVVGRFADDERIAAWDICNEPGVWSLEEPVQKLQADFVREMTGYAREAGPSQAITIGTMAGENVRIFADVVDVISIHPYADTAEQMAEMCEEGLAIGAEFGKPVIATEIGRGSMDDEKHVDMAMYSIEACERRGIGWFLWQLVAGVMIAARRDWVHGNTPPGDNAYMAFAMPDGEPRAGHERLAEWMARR